MQHAEEAAALGVTWPRGVLLHGPPGCGKSAAVHAVATEVGARVHELAASAVFGAHTGESERRLRDAFTAAAASAAPGQPAVRTAGAFHVSLGPVTEQHSSICCRCE